MMAEIIDGLEREYELYTMHDLKILAEKYFYITGINNKKQLIQEIVAVETANMVK